MEDLEAGLTTRCLIRGFLRSTWFESPACVTPKVTAMRRAWARGPYSFNMKRGPAVARALDNTRSPLNGWGGVLWTTCKRGCHIRFTVTPSSLHVFSISVPAVHVLEVLMVLRHKSMSGSLVNSVR